MIEQRVLSDDQFGGDTSSQDFLESCSFYDCMYPPACTVEETNETVNNKLQELEREIDKLPDSLREAYYIALREEIKQRTHYVRNKKLMLAFLRAEFFDVPSTAKRVALFYEQKMDLFGVEKLPRRITQDDLSDDDKKVLKSGFIHCAGPDCGGRLVYLVQWERLRAQGFLSTYFAKSICRVSFYLVFTIFECEETQKKGIVGVRWNVNSSLALKDYQVIFVSHVNMVFQAVPCRLAAFHSCCGSAASYMCVALMDSFLKTLSKHFCKIHGSTAVACISGLSSFGIDVDSLLLSLNGEFDVEAFHEKLKILHETEQIIKRRELEKDTALQARQAVDQLQIIDNSYHEIDALAESLKPQQKKNRSSMVSVSKEQPPVHAIDHMCKNLGEEHLPLKLIRILEMNTAFDSIWWIRDGTAFAIEKDRFTETVLKAQFNGIKMGSFLRRMRRWGFQRIANVGLAANCIAFKHPLFQKNSPHLLNDWGKEAKKEKFPTRLLNALQSDTASDAIWWIDNGNAFAIDKNNVGNLVLEKYFDGVKFKSFHRNMQRWDFKLKKDTGFGPNIMIFEHSFFQHDKPELMSKMVYT